MVSRLFHDLGCLIIDADLLAREVVEPGQPAYGKLVAEFGREILEADGQINRKRLGALVFSDAAKRKRLEELTHPAIRARQAGILEALTADGFDGIVIFDAALLVETGRAKNMDRLVVVTTDEPTQVKRLMLREGISAEEAARKIRSQMPLSEKVKQADYVIDNSGSPDAAERQVKEVHRKLQADLRTRHAPDPA